MANKLKFTIEKNSKFGRYMVAAKDLNAGEVIFRDSPLAVGCAIFENSVLCFACLRPIAKNFDCIKYQHRCGRCEVATLCSKACETVSGLHTSDECELLRKKQELCRDDIPLLTKILLHLRLWQWKLKESNDDIWRKILTLEAHMDKRRNTEVWKDRQKTVVDVFRKFEFVDESTTNEELQWLCGVLDVNTFELRSPGGLQSEDAPLLRGLFLEAAMMAHACRGNTHLTVDDDFRMAVYASVPIKKGDPIFFNYTSSLLSFIERQDHLMEGKYFKCDCSACRDPCEGGSHQSSILCPRCRKDYVGMQKPTAINPYSVQTKWQCQKCKRLYRGCLIRSAIELGKQLILQVDDTNTKELEELLDKLSKTFHRNHFLMMSVKQKMLVLYRKQISMTNVPRKVLQKMLALCREELAMLEVVEPGISRLKGIMLYEMHLPIAVLANRAYSAREISIQELSIRLEEAREVLKKSLTMLLLEPPSTPEGQLAKRALQEIKILARNIEDVNYLIEQENLDRASNRSQRHKFYKSQK